MINLVNLDQVTRGYMLQEVEMDIKANRLYDSPRLTKKGKEDYQGLLRTAIEHHDPHWLAEQLNAQGRMTSLEPGRSKKGTRFIKHTPSDDHRILAFGEFNRFYIRGVCARAIKEGKGHVIVYRALEASKPRRQSNALIGKEIDAQELLTDLRENEVDKTRLGIPGGANSGISVRLP
jgi:hypothetical protein